MEAEFTVNVLMRAGCRVLLVRGDLTFDNASVLEEALDATPFGQPVIVDLTRTRLVGSAGVQALLRARVAGQPVGLVRDPGSGTGRVLDIVKAEEVVRLFDDLDDAVAAIASDTRHRHRPRRTA